MKSEADAYNVYTELIEVETDKAPVYWARGVLLGRMGRYEEGLEDLGRALEVRPMFPEGL